MPRKKIKGMGDVVKAVTDAIGIEQCDTCKDRQELLNNIIPFGKYELTVDDIGVLNRIKNTTINSSIDKSFLFSTYNKVFCEKLKMCECQNQMQEMIQKLLTKNVE